MSRGVKAMRMTCWHVHTHLFVLLRRSRPLAGSLLHVRSSGLELHHRQLDGLYRVLQ